MLIVGKFLKFIVLINILERSFTSTEDIDIEVGYCSEYDANLGPDVTWSAQDNECVFSSPRCLDENFEIPKRCCIDGNFSSNSTCKIIEPPKTKMCPDNLEYHSGNALCYMTTEKQTYPPKCPSKDLINFHSYRLLVDQNLQEDEEEVWVPVLRDYSTTGYFYWMEYTSSYKTIFSEFNYNVIDSSLGGDCVVYGGETFRATPCTRKFKAICAYSRLDNLQSNYCGQKFTNNCKTQTYGPDLNCFCAGYNTSVDVDLQALKSDASDILFAFQNQVVAQLTTAECFIGLRKSSNKYMWSQSKTYLNYTFWSDKVEFGNNFTQGVFVSDGWTLTNSTAVKNCVIYHGRVDVQEPSLELTFDKSNVVFDLVVRNYKDLKSLVYVRKYVYVHCFTDASVSISKKPYRLPIIETSENGNILHVTFSPLIEGAPGNYWCEAVRFADFERILSNTILFEPGDFACEYIGIISYNYAKNISIMNPDTVNLIQKSLNFDKYYLVRIFKIISVNQTLLNARFNFHFSQNGWLYSEHCISEYPRIKSLIEQTIDNAISYNINIRLENLFSSKFCLPDTLTVAGVVLHWNYTEMNAWAWPSEVCLTADGELPLRKCGGNFIDGARWEDFKYTCKEVKSDNITSDLYNVLASNISASQKLNDLYNLTISYEYFTPVDIFLTSRILQEASSDSLDLHTVFNIVDYVSQINESILTASQEHYNKATDQILKSLDQVCYNLDVSRSKPEIIIISNNTFTAGINLLEKKLSGFILYKNNDEYKIEILYDLKNIDDLINRRSNFLVSLYLDESLRHEIITSVTTIPKFLITVHLKTALFIQEAVNTTDEEVRPVVNVLIPNFKKTFKTPLTVIYNLEGLKNISSSYCSYWHFGTDSINNNNPSFWQKESSPTNKSSLSICNFHHVTNFALLLISSTSNIDVGSLKFLDLITNINCCLSLFGLNGIIVTAVLFKSWRRNTGNQILVNFVFAIGFQIALLYSSDSIYNYVKVDDLCTVVGAMLHYSIISEFCWMLIIAGLQFKRFVQVFGGPPKYVMAKACVIGWIVPLFPVLCVLFLDPKCYVKNTIGLCYPSGVSLFLGIWLPVGIIVAINFVIFIYILYSVVNKNTETIIDNNETCFQFRLAVLLFFMLGLTWSFGLLTQLDFGVLFIYLFCFSATLQGFVMFLFFIIFNKNTRGMYKKLLTAKHL